MNFKMRYNIYMHNFKNSNLQKKSKFLPIRINAKSNFCVDLICAFFNSQVIQFSNMVYATLGEPNKLHKTYVIYNLTQ